MPQLIRGTTHLLSPVRVFQSPRSDFPAAFVLLYFIRFVCITFTCGLHHFLIMSCCRLLSKLHCRSALILMLLFYFPPGIMTLSRGPYELDKMSLFQDLKLKRRKVDSRCSSDGESVADTSTSSPDLVAPLSPKMMCEPHTPNNQQIQSSKFTPRIAIR